MTAKRISWVRPIISWVCPIDWCSRHDIPWANHSMLDISVEQACEAVEHWVEDIETVRKLGLPREAARMLNAETIWWCEVHRCGGREQGCGFTRMSYLQDCRMAKARLIVDGLDMEGEK